MVSHVQVRGVVPRIQYTADGSSQTYEFPFAVFEAGNIKVYLDDALQASTAYTVTGVRVSDGGSVTFTTAPTQGVVVTIVRDLPIERTTDFQEGGALRANTLNDELDYQIACQQQIADQLNRSMVLPPYAIDSNVNLTLPIPMAGKAIVWNSDGTNLENSTVSVNAMESILNGYKTAAETAATTATTKAGIASDKADIATTKAQLASDKADIATAKAAEATATLSSKANKDMDNLSSTGKQNISTFCFPDYDSGVTVSENTFTPDYSGVLVYNTSISAYLGTIGVKYGNAWLCSYKNPTSSSGGSITLVAILEKNKTYSIERDTNASIDFYPFKGEVNA